MKVTLREESKVLVSLNAGGINRKYAIGKLAGNVTIAKKSFLYRGESNQERNSQRNKKIRESQAAKGREQHLLRKITY